MTHVARSVKDMANRLEHAPLFARHGRVIQASGAIIRATGMQSVGEVCAISRVGKSPLLAEVVGFNAGQALLTPFGSLNGISAQSQISSVSSEFSVPVGASLIGRVVDALGAPLDGKGPIATQTQYPCIAPAPSPMTRPSINTVFPLGITSIDSALTCGVGQRLGIFAAAGGGKSTLLSMMVKFADYDSCVVALIGERGREVREFIEQQLGAAGMAKATVVVATSDRPAIEQVTAAYTATAMAEYQRDQGHRVLLLMDSLTRFARAQRQIGLSAGEPPTRRGFPPSVFEKLPGLVERAGQTETGSITALYSVLVEGDDLNEPVADEVRSLLDGHIVLSRKLAASGQYPAVDVLESTSRILTKIVPPEHAHAITRLRALLAKYNEIELLVRIGEYMPGSDSLGDEALQRHKAILELLKQDETQPQLFSDSVQKLKKAVGL